MGEVYRARDTRLDRTIAIKILPAQFSSDPVHKQRFESGRAPRPGIGQVPRALLEESGLRLH